MAVERLHLGIAAPHRQLLGLRCADTGKKCCADHRREDKARTARGPMMPDAGFLETNFRHGDPPHCDDDCPCSIICYATGCGSSDAYAADRSNTPHHSAANLSPAT